jgi:hypothetical protein
VDNLGVVLSALGDYAGAKAAHERAFHIRCSSLGQRHPDTRTSQQNLEALESKVRT